MSNDNIQNVSSELLMYVEIKIMSSIDRPCKFTRNKLKFSFLILLFVIRIWRYQIFSATVGTLQRFFSARIEQSYIPELTIIWYSIIFQFYYIYMFFRALTFVLVCVTIQTNKLSCLEVDRNPSLVFEYASVVTMTCRTILMSVYCWTLNS